ncbi:MAG: tyrosine-type recombinase/integrase [Planctomycetota bacterium]|jgi:integrase
MKDKQEPIGVFRKNTKNVADAMGSIREDDEIGEPTKEQIVGFLSCLAVEGLKPRTVFGYATTLRRLARMCPAKGFLQLGRRDIREMILSEQQKGRRTSTMNLFKARFLRFQRWLREEYGYPDDYPDERFAGKKLDIGEKPVEFRGIKSASRYSLPYGPDELLTQDDVNRMIDAAIGPRNRAIVAVLYESGARIHEFINLRIGSVEHTRYGWKIHIPTDTKTGGRPVMLVNSGPYVAAWLALHPFKDQPDAPLWIGTGTRCNAMRHFERTGKMLSMRANTMREILNELSRRADVKKRHNPHAFRHARATELAKHLKESELRAYMGWTPGSSMPGIYVHLSGRDTDAAILAAYGVRTSDSSRMLGRPQACPACSASNPNGARMCLKCGQPLNAETAKLADEAYREVGFALPMIAADQKLMKAFRRFLHKHEVKPAEEADDAGAAVSPVSSGAGQGLSRTTV